MKPRTTTVTVTRASAAPASQQQEAASGPLNFDFSGRTSAPAAGASTARGPKDDSIKQAIIRWLNEQL